MVELEPGESPINWLTRHYPGGCGGSVRYFVNGQELDLDDLDRVPEDGDLVTLAVMPAVPMAVLIPILITALITAVISVGLSLLLSAIFKKPGAPAFAQSDRPNPSSVYGVNFQQNTARIGEPVPVIYGRVLTTPDYAATPYLFHMNNDEYADILLTISAGEVDVHRILIGDSDVAQMDPLAVQYKVIPASVHLQTGGNLGFHPEPSAYAFVENMVTSPEVSQQTMEQAGDSAGYFRLSKTGIVGRFIQIDCVWPSGLYAMNTFGNVTETICEFHVLIQEVDAAGNPIGTVQDNAIFETTNSVTPWRRSFYFDAGKSGLWQVRMIRYAPAHTDGTVINSYQWTGAHLMADQPAGRVYGDVTLLAVRIKADRGISGAAQQEIRVDCTRRLPVLGAGALVATASPADAFVDIVTNAAYGARRPLLEVDTDRLAALAAYWGEGYEFNAVYSGRVTVWEALTQCVQVVAASPLPIGSLMSVAQDGPKPARTMLFSEQNIGAKSFQLSYQFDTEGTHDGVQVEYREPTNFAPAFVLWPANATDPDRVNLFGCTNRGRALEMAKLIWNRSRKLRRSVEFSTELEGLIPFLGDHVAVGHTLPAWGISGFVAQVAGALLTLDRVLPWDDVPGPWVMVFRDQDGGISDQVQVDRGPEDWQAVLSADPWAAGGAWHVGERQESTHYSWGAGSAVVKDFILTAITPKGTTKNGGAIVGLGGVIYDPSVYVDTLAFLANPVP